MAPPLKDLPRDVREQTAAAIRDRDQGLADDLSSALTQENTGDPAAIHTCAVAIIDLLARAIQEGELDDQRSAIDKVRGLDPPLGIRQMIRATQLAEHVVIDELALHERLGATSEAWALVTHSVRAATLEIAGAYAERDRGRHALRDELTTLLSRQVFDLALQQETQRARRHKHGVTIMAFDIDDMSALNTSHGYGAGDRLLERLGILAGRFFRTHDWVARYGGDAIAALLPDTTLDQAATLAGNFRETVQQRLVLVDHKTDATRTVTVSAAAVGTDLVQAELDPAYILAEADAALVRAALSGGNRVERVALLPTSPTIAKRLE